MISIARQIPGLSLRRAVRYSSTSTVTGNFINTTIPSSSNSQQPLSTSKHTNKPNTPTLLTEKDINPLLGSSTGHQSWFTRNYGDPLALYAKGMGRVSFDLMHGVETWISTRMVKKEKLSNRSQIRDIIRYDMLSTELGSVTDHTALFE